MISNLVLRDGIVAKRWSRFRTDKLNLQLHKENIMVKIILKVILLQKYLKSLMNKMVKILLSLDQQLLVILKLQRINLDENEAEISFDNVTAEQSSLLSFTFDPQRNGSTTDTIQVKILFVKRITGNVAKFTYTLNGYTGNGIYSGKVVLVPAFTGGGTTGLITVTNMEVDTDQTINCDVTIEYTSSPGPQ